MKKILVIVEGAVDESKLITSLFNVFRLKEEFDLISMEHNISMIFDKIKNTEDGYSSEPVDFKQVFIDILLSEGRIDDANLLRQKIPYIYLVFDLDTQHATFNFENVKEMLSFFNDETENGKLLINYPQFESFRDYVCPVPDMTFRDRTFDCTSTESYKKVVHRRGTRLNYSKFDKELFSSILLHNIFKANFISNGHFEKPPYSRFLETLENSSIIDKQRELYRSEKKIWVLCSLMFMIPLFYGNSLYGELEQICKM